MTIMQKRKHPRFNVPNAQTKNRKRVKERWRRPRGMDSKKRVHKLEAGALPGIGYKNSDTIRYARADGAFERLVHNEKELLAMKAEPGMVARLFHALSTRKRLALQKMAAEHKITIVNMTKEKPKPVVIEKKKAAQKTEVPVPPQVQKSEASAPTMPQPPKNEEMKK